MGRDEIQALFDRRLQAWARHDPAALAADYTEDAIVVSPFAGTVSGRADIEKVFRKFFAAFPDLGFNVKDLLIDGDRVALFLVATGTHRGDFFGFAASGRRFEVQMVSLYRMQNDRIAQENRIYDFTGLLIQVGVLKAKPGKD
jgi:steroid delta-isomerase-like uncharacterized protein